MTKTRIEIAWDEILEGMQAKPMAEDAFVLKRLDPDSRFDIFAGADGSSFVILAIGIRQIPPPIKLDSSSLDYFRQQRADGTWLMVLRLRQRSLFAVFGRVCQDLIEASSSVAEESDLVRLFRERLNLWKKLFERGGKGVLEDYEIKGLIAELLVLEEFLLDQGRSSLEAVSAWVGPTGADQDFLFSDVSAEVKAVGPGAEFVSISTLQQLSPDVPLTLHVLTLRAASPGEEGALSLNSLALRLEGVLSSSPDALAVFRGRLLEARYVEDEHYDTVVFDRVATEVFDVDEAFPKLTSDMVADGIVSATYCLSLDTIRKAS